MDKIAHWAKLAAFNTNFKNYEFEISGSTGNGDGFLGNVAFVKIINLDNKDNVLHLVIKSSNEDALLRSQLPLQNCFEKEIYIYNTVKPAFKKLQKNKNLLSFMPLLYAFEETGTSEMLILEDLSIKDFKLWDKLKPMTFDHIKLCLEAYANFNAFAFALKEKNKYDFQKLVSKNDTNGQSNFAITMLDLHLEMHETECMKALGYKLESYKKYLNFSKNEIKHALIDIFYEDPEDHVILHGDGWNNNFMFRTENDSNKPIEVKVIDWQCSAVGSPVLDLSILIYCCSDTETYKNVEDLLQIYHDYLTVALQDLGIEINKVFSFDRLLQHWKKYSIFGLIFGNYLLKYSHYDADEAPDFGKMVGNGKTLQENLTVFVRKDMVNEKLYINRVRNNLLHYVNNIK